MTEKMSEFLYTLTEQYNVRPSTPNSSNISRPRTVSHSRAGSTKGSKSLGVTEAITFSTMRPAHSDNSHLSASVSDAEGRSGAVTPAAPSISGSTSEQGSGSGSGSGTPDINHEVQVLSDKLVIALNHQTTLEEGLEDTRHELDASKKRIEELESIAKEHADMMAKGLLIEKKDVEMETKMLMNKLMEETVQRGKAEKEKRNIEQDLENLTTSLFEEANKMVIAARKEREAVLRRNDQLEQQLADTAVLLQTHQEQLVELKDALQHMTREREELEASSTPSTPAMHTAVTKESLDRLFETLHVPSIEDVAPSHPTSFENILQPVLRSDIASYKDFRMLVRMSKYYSPTPPKQPSTTLGSFGVLGLSGSPNRSPKISPTSIFGHSSARSVSSVQSAASGSSFLTVNTLPPAPPLKDTPFFKRVLMEDIEPTLRLDTAPGLSWLARRTVLTGVIEGTLVIEAMPTKSKLPIFACSLCGENRNDPTHARLYRFRANETEGAQKYPLCTFCCNRVRSVCEFMAFLRTAKEGYLKCETEEDEQGAWEESVKLRERMFWSRIGGGVVPSLAHIKDDIIRSVTANSSRENLSDISALSPTVKMEPAPPPLPARRSSDLQTREAAIKEEEAPLEEKVEQFEQFEQAEKIEQEESEKKVEEVVEPAAPKSDADTTSSQLPSPPASPVDHPSKPAEILLEKTNEKLKAQTEQQEHVNANDDAQKA